MYAYIKFVVKIWLTLVACCATVAIASTNDFYISDFSETTEDNAPALVVRFTEAISPDTNLSQFITLTPLPDTGASWIPQNNGYQWVFPFVEPSTDYSISASNHLKSVKNHTLSRPDNRSGSIIHTLTTRRIEPGATFKSSGQFLVDSIQNGLPVTVINQKQVDLDIFRVRDDMLNQFINETYYQGKKYYSRLNDLKQYADLVHSARFENNAKENQRTTYNFDLTPVFSKHKNGMYVAVMRQPGQYEYTYDTTFFTVTDIGLHARKYRDSMSLYTHSIRTGQPLSNVELSLWWPKTRSVDERTQHARTGLDGSYQLASNDMPDIIIAKQGNDISYLNFSSGALDLSDYPNVPTIHRNYQMFMYGPRDLYRPGEEVPINLLLRDFDGNKVKGMPLEANLFDARGERKQTFVWQAGPTGLYKKTFKLSDKAATGEWLLQVKISGQREMEHYRFKVEDFMPETMTLSFYDGDRNQSRYAQPGAFLIPIQGDYLYGAPAADNIVDGIITASPANYLFKDLKGFYFGDRKAYVPNRTERIPEIRLNEKGQANIEIPGFWQDSKIPLAFRVSASLYQNGGRPVTRTQKVIQLPNFEKLPGVRPQFQGRPESNSTVLFNLLSASKDGTKVSDELKVRLLRDHREYFWEYDSSRGWHWDYQSHQYVSASETVELHNDISTIEFPVEWGSYTLEVTSESGAKTQYHFETQWNWNNQDSRSIQPDKLKMALDKSHYVPGSSAQLRLLSPISGDSIINVESSQGVEFSMRKPITKGENLIDIQTSEFWKRHDLYISVMVISPADQVTEVAPKRALGILHLPLRREDAEAHITLDVPEKIEPNKTIKARISVENQAELGDQTLYATVALVDKGVLNITRFQPPKPEQYFFAPRRFESDYYDMYGKIINNLGYENLKQRFGGDMFDESDEELSRGGEKPKSDVQIVSFFSDPVALTDDETSVSFDLPEFNGKLEWMIVVYGDRSYGSADAQTVVADKLVSQISMPRFLSMGDQSQITLDLHNLSGESQDLQVKVETTGSITSSPLSDSLLLKDKEKTSLSMMITASEMEGLGTIRLTATNGNDINLDRSWRVGVRSPYPWQSIETQTTLSPNQTWEPLVDLSGLRESTVQGMLTVSDRPAINFSSQFENLLAYPYGCLEQTTSSSYPWLLLSPELADEFGLRKSIEAEFGTQYTDSFRIAQAQKGIDRLKSKQLSNGGFGYWDSGSWESRWGTVYATEFLIEAREQGANVDDSMIRRATKRLKEYLRETNTPSLWSDSADYYSFAYQTYAAYVLAKANYTSLSQLRRLHTQALGRPELAKSGLAWMHLAGAFALLNDNNRAEKARQKAMKIEREKYAYYRDYGSRLRDSALSLSIALELGFDEEGLADKVVRELHNKYWKSTQERISLARLATLYGSKESAWTGAIETANGETPLSKDHSFSTRLNVDQLKSLVAIKSDDKKLYTNLVYHGAPLNAPKPVSSGMTISRHYFDLNGNSITPNTLPSGELIVVRLDIKANKDIRIPDALVVDLLPAGLELENQNLENASVNLDNIVIDGSSLGSHFREYQTQYMEYRDDRFVAAIDVNDWQATTLYYLARAVTPGVYQVAPPYVEDMYRSDYRAIGKTISTIEIKAR